MTLLDHILNYVEQSTVKPPQELQESPSGTYVLAKNTHAGFDYGMRHPEPLDEMIETLAYEQHRYGQEYIHFKGSDTHWYCVDRNGKYWHFYIVSLEQAVEYLKSKNVTTNT